MDLTTLTERLDERLRTDEYAAVDASANGLQVGRPGPGVPPEAGDREVGHVALAVDAAVATAERAAALGADLLVTHHGLVWGGLERVTGRQHRRLAAFVEHDLPLYVSHLPLDGHPELGNAVGVADLLGVVDREPFGDLGGVHAGLRGRLDGPRSPADLHETLAADLDTGDGRVRTLDLGPERVERAAIVTGSGTDFLDEAAAAGVDALVTGEGKGKAYHEAREAGLNVVLGGHYATETVGVRRLGELIEDWGVETTFLDHPTGL
ncbi:Nif3-like dinuclear metal center hexameric protein [Halobacteriales archaeon SW_5_70_135]|nr:MAG: Nif3-like dinuclear metal center hexameric protein [Halobacteriales archaeon SW_5_70_135]